MNRREFLKSVVAAYVGAQIPFSLVPVVPSPFTIEAPPPSSPEVISSLAGWARFIDLQAYGESNEHKPAIVTVSRARYGMGTLLRLALSTKGGLARWCACTGEEILIAPQDLLIETSHPDIRVAAVMRDFHEHDVLLIKDERGTILRVMVEEGDKEEETDYDDGDYWEEYD